MEWCLRISKLILGRKIKASEWEWLEIMKTCKYGNGGLLLMYLSMGKWYLTYFGYQLTQGWLISSFLTHEHFINLELNAEGVVSMNSTTFSYTLHQ
jgi:hypothetical protein